MSDPRERLAIILDGIDAELDNVRIIPDGADEPLPLVPDSVVITENDVEFADRRWNEVMTDYQDMLSD